MLDALDGIPCQLPAIFEIRRTHQNVRKRARSQLSTAMPQAHHNLVRALMLAPTLAPMPQRAAGTVRAQPENRLLRRTSTALSRPLPRGGAFLKAHLVVVALLQLLTGALAVQWRQLEDGGGMSRGASGARSGRSGEEEVAGVYRDGGDGAAGDLGGSGNPASASRELSSPGRRGIHSFLITRCSIDSQCLVLHAWLRPGRC